MAHTAELYLAPDNIEQHIAFMARVSNPSGQNNPEFAKLLARFVRTKEWSPFEMVNLVFEINTTRSIGRQLLRHRSFTFQEFSQRYASPEMMPNSAFPAARLQDPTNRQDSTETEDEELLAYFQYAQDSILDHVMEEYNHAIARGVAKELARNLLPEGLTLTKLYMNGTLRSWIHFCQLRCGNGTQKETTRIANQVRDQIIERCPNIADIFE